MIIIRRTYSSQREMKKTTNQIKSCLPWQRDEEHCLSINLPMQLNTGGHHRFLSGWTTARFRNRVIERGGSLPRESRSGWRLLRNIDLEPVPSRSTEAAVIPAIHLSAQMCSQCSRMRCLRRVRLCNNTRHHLRQTAFTSSHNNAELRTQRTLAPDTPPPLSPPHCDTLSFVHHYREVNFESSWKHPVYVSKKMIMSRIVLLHHSICNHMQNICSNINIR